MPAWLKDAIFYEIYPQSFQDTNADGIGDIPGIIHRLDYIRELGCNALWLNPCFASPFLDAGYDVADYYTVAPRYGTNEDLKNLFAEAHKRGMHVLLDLVPGHTAAEHPWFRESCKAEKNPYTDRYVWTDEVWRIPEGMNTIRGFSERDGACVVNFFSHQPALNYGFLNPAESWQQSMDAPGPQATLAEMKNVMAFWLSMGCDGFRVDMAGSLVKNDPEQEGTIALWRQVFAWLEKAFPEAAMVSEWGEPDRSLRAGFHMDFLLHFGPSHYNDLFRCDNAFFAGNGDASAFVKAYEATRAKAEQGLICIPSGNHDMQRLTTHLPEDGVRIAFAFLLSMPGAPFLYYGDEIGMRYLWDLPSKEGGYSRTGARTPMQWDRTANAGFSSAAPEKLYLPIDPAGDRPTVEAQMTDPGSLYQEVRHLIEVRRANPALGNLGRLRFVYAPEKACPLVYLREAEGERVLVILNPSETAGTFPWTEGLGKRIYDQGGAASVENGTVTVPAKSASFYRV